MDTKQAQNGKWRKILFAALLIVSLLLNLVLLARSAGTKTVGGEEPVGAHDAAADSGSDDTKTVSGEEFAELTRTIDEGFQVDGYQEVLSKNNMELTMDLPMRSGDATFDKRGKVFVYKSAEKNVVIMMELSYSGLPTPKEEHWLASFGYTPAFLNSTDYLSEYYDPELPPIFLATSSFCYDGIYYTLTGFSDTAADILAENELTQFINALLSFLKEQKVTVEAG